MVDSRAVPEECEDSRNNPRNSQRASSISCTASLLRRKKGAGAAMSLESVKQALTYPSGSRRTSDWVVNVRVDHQRGLSHVVHGRPSFGPTPMKRAGGTIAPRLQVRAAQG